MITMSRFCMLRQTILARSEIHSRSPSLRANLLSKVRSYFTARMSPGFPPDSLYLPLLNVSVRGPGIKWSLVIILEWGGMDVRLRYHGFKRGPQPPAAVPSNIASPRDEMPRAGKWGHGPVQERSRRKSYRSWIGVRKFWGN